MKKTKFYWENATNLAGNPIKVRMDVNGVKIPKSDWDNHDFEEISKPRKAPDKAEKVTPPPPPPPPPPKKVVTFTRFYDESSKTMTIKDSDGILSLVCKWSTVPFCCGMREIGSYTTGYQKGKVPEEFGKFLDDAMKRFIADVSLHDYETNRKRELITNLIDEQLGCQLVKDSFERTGDFILVKDFINENTGRRIEFYTTSN